MILVKLANQKHLQSTPWWYMCVCCILQGLLKSPALILNHGRSKPGVSTIFVKPDLRLKSTPM